MHVKIASRASGVQNAEANVFDMLSVKFQAKIAILL